MASDYPVTSDAVTLYSSREVREVAISTTQLPVLKFLCSDHIDSSKPEWISKEVQYAFQT
jgi:hypothetical protein